MSHCNMSGANTDTHRPILQDAPAATVTLTPFGMGRPQLKRLKGMARTQFAEWMARELTHRAGVRDGLVEGAQLPTPCPCRAARSATCSVTCARLSISMARSTWSS